MKSRVTRCGYTHELSLIAAAVCLLAVAFSLPGRLYRVFAGILKIIKREINPAPQTQSGRPGTCRGVQHRENT